MISAFRSSSNHHHHRGGRRSTEGLFKYVMMLLLVACQWNSRCVVNSMRLLKSPLRVATAHFSSSGSGSFNSFSTSGVSSSRLSSAAAAEDGSKPTSGDLMIQALNGAQDISVKVLSCREIVQESILKNDLSSLAAKSLGETLVSALLMGAGLKGDESLQVNIVGTMGLKNLMVITNGALEVRGMVGQPDFSIPADVRQRSSKLPVMTEDGTPLSATASKVTAAAAVIDDATAAAAAAVVAAAGSGTDTSSTGFTDPMELTTAQLLGAGQIQVVRNHPSWKQPMNGITALRDTTIAMNLALYLAESEQRPAVLLTDVHIDGGLCRCALGVLVERLPGCSDENLEAAVANVKLVQQRGLRQYLQRTDEEIERSRSSGEMFRSFEDSLNRVVDDCIRGMDADSDSDSLRWSKVPSYKCSCSTERIWRTLRTLPRDELLNIVEVNENIEMKCEFCGTKYEVTAGEIKSTFEL